MIQPSLRAPGLALCALASSGVAFAATNFGTVEIASSVTNAVTITLPTDTQLTAISVLTAGVPNLDFTDAGGGTCAVDTSYTANSTCTVNVTFTPQFSQTRTGAVVLSDADGVVTTTYIEGVGSGPQLNFVSSAQKVIARTLSSTSSVAVDGSGSLYISGLTGILKETYSNGSYTQKVIPTTGLQRSDGIAIDAAGNLYVADFQGRDVIELVRSAGSYVQETVVSGLEGPTSVAVDSDGVVYILDYTAGQVLKETPTSSGFSQSVAISKFDNGVPNLIAVDANGSLFLETGQGVYVETLVSGQYMGSFTKLTGVGFGMALDPSGNIYLSDGNETISRVNLNAEGGPQVTRVVSVYAAGALAFDGAGNLYVLTRDGEAVGLPFGQAPSVDFLSVPYGTPSFKESLILENIGNADLQFPIPTAGNNPTLSGPFVVTSTAKTACPAVSFDSSNPGTLTSGTTCEFTLSFDPTKLGSATGSLVFTDNNLNAAGPNYATQTIQLSGAEVKGNQQISISKYPTQVTYGAKPIEITATAPDTGNPVTLTVKGPAKLVGKMLSFTAGGLVTLKASAAGNADYLPATGTIQIGVNRATLVMTAKNAIRKYGQPNPAFQYKVTGYVNGDTAATAYRGVPKLATQATKLSPVGKYQIVPEVGTLVSNKYNFKFVFGTLTVTVAGATAPPKFTPGTGTYKGSTTVKITDATPAAFIYYTLDGSEPTTSSAVSYESVSIVVTQHETIKAMAMANGWAKSAVASATYTIQ